MVKKVKRFIVLVLVSFLYSFLFGRSAEAANKGVKVYLVPKTATGNLKYNGNDAGVAAGRIADEMGRTVPGEPTTKPEEPTTKPEEPTTKPEEPTTKPEEPTTKPEEPTTKPEEP